MARQMPYPGFNRFWCSAQTGNTFLHRGPAALLKRGAGSFSPNLPQKKREKHPDPVPNLISPIPKNPTFGGRWILSLFWPCTRKGADPTAARQS